MNKGRFFTLTIIIITLLALTVNNSKLPAAQAQTPNPTWQLTITGLVENPMNLTLDDIEAMPQITEGAILYCVGSPSTPVDQGDWTGVELSYLLQQANLSSEAIKVAFYASDGFTTDLTVQTAMRDNSILVAYLQNNVSLSGLQLVVPYNWGYKWISDLTQIQLVNFNFTGTEESNGYPDDGTTGYFASAGAIIEPGVPYNQQSTISTPNPTPSPQNSTPTPTDLASSPIPTLNPTTPPVASNPIPQPTSTFLDYIATVSIIILTSAVASGVVLTKRKKAKT